VRIRWTRFALADLIAARDHLASVDPGIAEAMLGGVSDALARLRKHPRMGRTVPERAALGYREVVLPPYRLVYLLAGSEIQVLRFWHSRRDPAGM
jgi:plasmid stabilization system protein ParE